MRGLPRRDWFKHQIYAPGFYTGYGVKTMPQIREGLEENRPDESKEGVRKVAAAIDALATQVDEAATLLKKSCRRTKRWITRPSGARGRRPTAPRRQSNQ